MGLFDGVDSQGFADRGGLLGRLLSLRPDLAAFSPLSLQNWAPSTLASTPPDLGGRLEAAFQNQAQTPIGDPSAALSNGVSDGTAGRRTNIPIVEKQNAELASSIGQRMTDGRLPDLTKVGYYEIPANPNLAFSQLWGIQASREKDMVSGSDYASGVREGNVKRNEDGSLDVTDGTVVTLSWKDSSARIVTVTGSDVAHINPSTGEVVVQKSPSGDRM